MSAALEAARLPNAAAAVGTAAALIAQQQAALSCVLACQRLAVDLGTAKQPLEPADALRAAAYMPLLLEAGRAALEFAELSLGAASYQMVGGILISSAATVRAAFWAARIHGISTAFAAELAPPPAVTAWLSTALALAKAVTKPALLPGSFQLLHGS